jgi:hypothetical protein
MHIRRLPLALALLAAAVLPAAAHAQKQPVRIPPLYVRYRPPVAPPARPVVDSTGLRFRLSDGEGHAATPSRGATASWARLSARETDALLARLPALQQQRTPADSFAFPAQTFPAPRAGNVVLAEFPPRETAPPRPTETGGPAPLAVTRRAPEGDVELGAEITVTFSQPMVPLASVGEVASREVPVRMLPRAPGAWRWIDVRTVKFEPAGRLPMATEFTVEVPAGTAAASGGRLAAAERWTFSTPAPRAIGGYPYSSPVRLQPVFVVAFDQRIDPAAVLRTVRLTAGRVRQPVRLATRAEIDADPEAKALAAGQDAGRWMAFRPVQPLPRDAGVEVQVGPATPSAEGPRVTDVEQGWSVRTYGALRMERSRCGWREGECRPGYPWQFEFTNPLDDSAFKATQVTVAPALPGMSVGVYGNTVGISGRARPNTRYTVQIAGVRDRFGQTLGAPARAVFDVGAPEAELNGPSGEMVVLDPVGPREVSVISHDHRRLRVRVMRVTAADWPAYRAFLQGVRTRDTPPRLPGQAVSDRTVTIDAPAGDRRATRVDVAPALADGIGHAIVAVEAVEGATEEERAQSVFLWVQSTRIGLAAFSDNQELVAWATSLVDGAPLPGVRVSLLPRTQAQGASTAADGTATLPLPPATTSNEGDLYLVAEQGGDAAILARGVGNTGWARWLASDPGAAAAWYGVTDRNLYRPGETVRFKGWVRLVSQRKGGQVDLPGAGTGDQLTFRVLDPRNNEIAKGTAALSALSGFDGSFAIPEGTNLGNGRIELSYQRDGRPPGWTTNLYFQVQEFRRPEYTVTAEAQPGPHLVGESAEVTARAAYYAGGALPAAPVRWDVTATPGRYTPPGWSEWSFGPREGWGWLGEWDGASVKRQTHEGTTDAQGAHSLRIDFDGVDPPRPYNVSAQATVTDVNRQTWTAGAQLLVHPADVYVGVRMERGWLELGDSIDLDVVVVDLDGRPVAGRPVEVRAARRTWGRSAEGERSQDVKHDWGRCDVASAPQPVRCVFRPDESGLYDVTLVVRDERGRLNRTQIAVWVSGREASAFTPPEMGDEGSVRLMPDRPTYAPGDTARVLLRLPFTPARGVVTLRRSGLVERWEIESREPSYTLRIPIRDEHVPNLHVQVDIVGAAKPSAEDSSSARGVDFASGATTLSIPPATRALKVAAVPADSALEPDTETSLDVEVRDAAGRPVSGAEVAVVVVDEAVLALSGYTFADPLSIFYPARAPGVSDVRLRPLVLVQVPDYTPAPGTLVGRVISADLGEPVAAGTVRLVGTGLETETDTHGRFRLSRVPRGTHTLEVDVPGFQRARISVTVGEDAPPPLRVLLVSDTTGTMAGEIVGQGMAGGVAQETSASAADMSSPPAPPPPPPPPAPVMARGAVSSKEEAAPIAMRTNFDPLAVFSPAVRTGADGRRAWPTGSPPTSPATA